jgi:hypothetical protein
VTDCLSGAAAAAAELQKRSTTYHRLVHSFSVDFVIDAHGQGWQFNGVVHGMRAL